MTRDRSLVMYGCSLLFFFFGLSVVLSVVLTIPFAHSFAFWQGVESGFITVKIHMDQIDSRLVESCKCFVLLLKK